MKSRFLLLLSFAAPLLIYAQDAFYTHQNYGLSMINPAYVGSLACARAEMGYRLQWPALNASYRTMNFAYDQYFKAGGFGINYMHDNAAGLLKTNRLDLNYSYGFGIGVEDDGKSKAVLQPGIQISWLNKRVEWDKLTFNSQIDPRRGLVYNTNETPDMGARNMVDVSFGLLFNSKRICAGVAVFHLAEPNESYYGNAPLPRRYVAHGSFIIGNYNAEDDALSVIPSVLYMRQQDVQQISVIVLTKFKGARAGAGIRTGDALLFTAGYTWNKFTVSYSYDHTISALGKTGGSHEVHLSCLLFTEKWSLGLRNTQAFL